MSIDSPSYERAVELIEEYILRAEQAEKQLAEVRFNLDAELLRVKMLSAGWKATNKLLDDAKAELAAKDAEIQRLHEGQFTREEIHQFCHNLPDTVSAEEFAKGCAAEQIKLYGHAPERQLLTQLAGFLRMIVEGFVPADTRIKKEAEELSEKIGKVFVES